MSLGDTFIDAKRAARTIVSRDGADDFPRFALQYVTGAASSALEHGIFRKLLGRPGGSTMFYLEEAALNEVPLFAVRPDNLDAVRPQLELTPSQLQIVEDSVADGLHVIVPRRAQSFFGGEDGHGTSGFGLIAFDPDSGSGAFLITQSLLGGQPLVTLQDLSAEEQRQHLEDQWGFLSAAGFEFVVGDWCKKPFDNPAAQAGAGVGAFLSGLAVYGDVSNLIANGVLIAKSGGERGKLDFFLTTVAFAPGVGDYIKNSKYGPKFLRLLARTKTKSGEQVVKLYRRAARAVKNLKEGAKTPAQDALMNMLKNGQGEAFEEVTGRTLLNLFAASANFKNKGGVNVGQLAVSDGDLFVRSLGVRAGGGLPDGALKGLTAAQKGDIGERTADVVARERSWQRLTILREEAEAAGRAGGKTPTTPGLDRVYRDQNGDLVIVEGKFKNNAENVGPGELKTTVKNTRTGTKVKQTELSDDWLLGPVDPKTGRRGQGAIDRSLENRTITTAQAEELKQAVSQGKAKKLIVTVRNNDSGNTVTSTLGRNAELGVNSSSPVGAVQVNIGDTVEK